jgi:ribonuclease Z
VVAFRAVHRTPTLGYALVRTKKRLRDGYRKLGSEALAELRRDGRVLEDTIDVPEVVFCGDTNIDVVEREEIVRTAKLLILEVTFLDDRVPPDAARKKGHVHLDQVVERADLFENEAILLTHISQRYAPSQIRKILDDKLPKSLRDRVTPLMPKAPWSRE